MKADLAKPRLGRRAVRWALATLLAGAVGLWWMTQPVLDLRVVGDWKTQNGSGYIIRRFSANGTCVTLVGGADERSPMGSPQRWHMEAGEIVIKRDTNVLTELCESIKTRILGMRGIRVQRIHFNLPRGRLIETSRGELLLELIRSPLPNGTPRTEIYVRLERAE